MDILIELADMVDVFEYTTGLVFALGFVVIVGFMCKSGNNKF